MKAKQDEIAELNGEIETLKNRIYGYEAQVALWRHEIARVSEKYDKNIAYYSNPALIEIQLQVISEFVESLVRFSGCHKWDAEALKTVEKYRKSIGDLLEKLVGTGEGPPERDGLPAGVGEGRRRQGRRGRPGYAGYPVGRGRPAVRFGWVQSIHGRGEFGVGSRSLSDGPMRSGKGFGPPGFALPSKHGPDPPQHEHSDCDRLHLAARSDLMRLCRRRHQDESFAPSWPAGACLIPSCPRRSASR